jgi:hypothetical protein
VSWHSRAPGSAGATVAELETKQRLGRQSRLNAHERARAGQRLDQFTQAAQPGLADSDADGESLGVGDCGSGMDDLSG